MGIDPDARYELEGNVGLRTGENPEKKVFRFDGPLSLSYRGPDRIGQHLPGPAGEGSSATDASARSRGTVDFDSDRRQCRQVEFVEAGTQIVQRHSEHLAHKGRRNRCDTQKQMLGADGGIGTTFRLL